MPKIIYLK